VALLSPPDVESPERGVLLPVPVIVMTELKDDLSYLPFIGHVTFEWFMHGRYP
jgi:hypothetical protein